MELRKNDENIWDDRPWLDELLPRHREVRQQKEGMLTSQNKYIEISLKKFKMSDENFVVTPLVTNGKMQKDDRAQEVDVSYQRCLIKNLLYLTTKKPKIM